MRFSDYVEIREVERRATIDALLAEIQELKEQLIKYAVLVKQAEKAKPYQQTKIGFKRGSK